MAKYFNNRVKSGKVGGSVLSVRYGEVIERAYNPIVLNPNTEAQVAARAKMKLMSQLGAVLSSVIAIRRVGAQSSRNLFVKRNYGLATYAGNQADIAIARLQITNSAVSIGAVTAARGESAITASIAQTSSPYDVNRVVFVLLGKMSDNTLRMLGTQVATTAGETNSWPVQFPLYAGECVVLAYGVRDNTENARVMFGNLQVTTAEAVAKLIVSRTLMETDVTLTETTGYTLAVN